MDVSKFEIGIIKLVDRAFQKGKSENEILKKIRDVVDSVPEFNIREKNKLYIAAKRLIQTGWKPCNMQLKRFCTEVNKTNEHYRARVRKTGIAEMLRVGRANEGVFYLCSSHSNPACGHAEYQGMIYVDRFWRNTLKDNPKLQDEVAAYIKNHSCKTVQEMCHAPVFLITRPYCKHYFIPIPVDEVLHSSLNKIKKDHPEYRAKEHNINYRKKFYKQRRRLHMALGMQAEAGHDTYIINRQG